MEYIIYFIDKLIMSYLKLWYIWFYSVMVSTLDFESSDPSSNLGRTINKIFLSNYFKLSFINWLLHKLQQGAAVAEWLRRWTWNPMGSARAGSNPACCEKSFSSQFAQILKKWCCLLWGLNSWPLVYETSALQLS